MTSRPSRLGPRTLLSPSTPPPSLGTHTLSHLPPTHWLLPSIYFLSLILSKSNTPSACLTCLPAGLGSTSSSPWPKPNVRPSSKTWLCPALPMWENNSPHHPVAQGRNNGGTLTSSSHLPVKSFGTCPLNLSLRSFHLSTTRPPPC